jgi:hypothetical protein
VKGTSHWFNRIRVDDGSVDIDLTGDQFELPKVRVEMPGRLFPGTRVRSFEQVLPETLERAALLAARSGLKEISEDLRATLGSRQVVAHSN